MPLMLPGSRGAAAPAHRPARGRRGLLSALGSLPLSAGPLSAGSLPAAALSAWPFAGARAQAQAQAQADGPLVLRLALIEGLSGAFANAGEAVARNLVFAIERHNADPVRVGGRPLRLELLRLDSRGEVEGAISMLTSAVDRGVRVVLQGNSSAVAVGLLEAVDRHNGRHPGAEVLFLNYSALDPALTRERCSFWHFRFDADLEMRLTALVGVMREDRAVRRVYLINQNYSFGQQFARAARRMLGEARPDVEIVGDDLVPIGRVKDFSPYAQKIRASGADTVMTGNWGNDLTLLVRAARESGLETRFHTFYANGLGAPAAIGAAGAGRVTAVAEWHYNAGVPGMDALYAAFRERFPAPADDYFHARMQLMIAMLAESAAAAGAIDAPALARAFEGRRTRLGGLSMTMRADDHQAQADLYVSEMDAKGTPGVTRDIEGSGFGFRTLRRLPAAEVAVAPACRMARPAGR